MARRDDEKDPRELEQEVEQQRSSIEQTLAELIERFSPQQLFQQFLGGGSSQQPRQILELLKANPIPTLMAAAGVGWLMMSQSRNPESRSASHASAASAEPWDEPSHASYGVDPDYDPHSGEGHVALEKTEPETDASASLASKESSSYEDNLGANVNSVMGSQPLLVAAVGLAIGSVLAATLPRSSREGESVSSGDPLRSSARERKPDRESALGEAEPLQDGPTRH